MEKLRRATTLLLVCVMVFCATAEASQLEELPAAEGAEGALSMGEKARVRNGVYEALLEAEEERQRAAEEASSGIREDNLGDSSVDATAPPAAHAAREDTQTQRLAEAIGTEISKEAAPSGEAWKQVAGNMQVEGRLSTESLTVRKSLQARGISAASITRGTKPSGNETYVFSGLHCFWNGQQFTGCPSKKVSWGGIANFNPPQAAPLATDPKSLRVPFKEPYSGRPLCSVSFQDMAVLVRAKPSDTHVDVSVFSDGGCDRKWGEVQSWVTVICHGTRKVAV